MAYVFDLLYSKLGSLVRYAHPLAIRITSRGLNEGKKAYRQHTQQRGFPCILEPDHRDIHLRRPAFAIDHHMALFLAHLKPQLFFFFQARIIQNLAILRGTARGMEGYFICGRKQHHDKLAHLPEHPQKPVINGTKDSSHGDGLYPRRREHDQDRNKGEYICF